MSIPETLTIRHFSPKEVTLERIERFPLPAAKPIPPRLGNITDIGNLTLNFTGLLNKTPLGKVQPITNILPTPSLDNAKLAESHKPFATETVSLKLAPFQTLKSNIRLTQDSPNEILRIFFTCSGAQFRLDVNPRSSKASTQLLSLTPGSGVDYHAIWHQAASHLSLISTAPLQKWQSSLPDITPLSALSIPGTHNSPTCYVALPSVRCQAVGITAQLEHGIRFFDIRCNPDGSNLTLIHGNFPIALSGTKHLRDILHEAYSFLDKNPSETILVSLKREGPAKVSDQEFSKILHDNFISKALERWYTIPVIPTLGEVRGKCVLFRRFHIHDDLRSQNNTGYGINAEHWEYNTTNHTTASGDIIVQDFCEVVETENIDKKITYVRDHLARASMATYSHGALDPAKKIPFYVNFLSASNFWKMGCWPEKVAERLNPSIRTYLAIEHDMSKGDGGTGVVVCDFVGEGGDWDVVRLTVAMNGVLEVRAKRREVQERERKQKEERRDKVKEDQVEKEKEKERKHANENMKENEKPKPSSTGDEKKAATENTAQEL